MISFESFGKMLNDKLLNGYNGFTAQFEPKMSAIRCNENAPRPINDVFKRSLAKNTAIKVIITPNTKEWPSV